MRDRACNERSEFQGLDITCVRISFPGNAYRDRADNGIRVIERAFAANKRYESIPGSPGNFIGREQAGSGRTAQSDRVFEKNVGVPGRVARDNDYL